MNLHTTDKNNYSTINIILHENQQETDEHNKNKTKSRSFKPDENISTRGKVSPAIAIGFMMSLKALEAIAKRAIKTNDSVIILELEAIGLLSFSSPEERKHFLDLGKEIDPETYDYQ